MANRKIFFWRSRRQSRTDENLLADAINEAGGAAYRFDARHALAQLAATGTFEDTYYATGESQLSQVLKLIEQIEDAQYLAKLAVYAREKAFMKDMPAALLVALSRRDTQLMHRVFDRVVDHGKVLRSVFQMVRSGQFTSLHGVVRRGLSSSMKRAFQRWLNEASVIRLLNASIGNDPTMRDILRMARPTPKDDQRRALFGWLAGRDVASWGPATESDLPLEVQRLEKYRRAEREEEQLEVLEALRGVRWELFADGAKGPKVWARIAETMGPQALRMNLNTLARHEVFGERSRDGRSMMELVAARIADEKEVRQSRQFPYQYFTSYLFAEEGVPERVRKSLNEAAEIACGNVPKLPGPIVIGLDASGSMGSPVTGKRTASGTTKMTCRDVAALIAAALLRANPGSVVIPFDTQAYTGWYQRLRQPASILELAGYLKGFGGGGTNCAVPVEAAMKHFGEREFAGVVIISDNESWWGRGHAGSTALATAWKAFVFRQRLQFKTQFHPKLVCIDLQPNTTTQVPDRQDVLNIGGFSDSVFSTIGRFFDGAPKHWVDEVEAIEL